MSEFLTGLLERIHTNPIEIAYSAIIFVGTAGLVLLVIRIILMVRRWYLHSVLRRQSLDYQTEVKYIKGNQKPINQVQRFFLGQTGKILGYDVVITIVITIVFCCLGVWLIGKIDYESVIVIWCFRVFSLCYLFFSIVRFAVSLYDLGRYARIIPFLLNLLLIVESGACIYIYFFMISV